ncbi:hypothetical protein THAOC_17499 [Thalassiosira oceanica]|uniref:Uncharacterized protein n=1 Tax=Thalassiosira oceanica TaxID=159749 RepID=K0SLT9_THAOC|nr:hypothetical protein THAOC_17499 [Thalassiosira oceanica]|eukprot:EJK61921.1 hypothetical protein THAOC_17499 [Thalassiosira oceanica]
MNDEYVLLLHHELALEHLNSGRRHHFFLSDALCCSHLCKCLQSSSSSSSSSSSTSSSTSISILVGLRGKNSSLSDEERSL